MSIADRRRTLVDSRRRAAILGRLATRSGAAPSIDDLCVVSAELVGVTGAGITLMNRDRRDQLQAGASDQVSARLEELQFTLGEGPCLDAHHSGQPVLEPDLAHPDQPRWPAMRAAALEAGVAAIFGFPLTAGPARIGALDLYRDRPGRLDPDQYADALEMADVAARAVLSVQTDHPVDQLSPELPDANLRYLVHQAAGALSVQLSISVDDALDRLRARAFADHRPIEDVAADVIAHVLRLD